MALSRAACQRRPAEVGVPHIPRMNCGSCQSQTRYGCTSTFTGSLFQR